MISFETSVKSLNVERVEIRDNIFVMFCAALYHMCNLKNVKNTHGGMLRVEIFKVSTK